MLLSRLLVMLLSRKWERVKCRGPCKSLWLPARIESLKKELDLQNKVLDIKLIYNAIESRELREFEMALQKKSKLCIYKQLKGEVGIEQHLEYVKRDHARLLFKFHSGTHCFFEL